MLLLAAAGVVVPWNARPTIAVIVDRTASTRTAAWHDADPTPFIRAAVGRDADLVRIIDTAEQLTAAPDADIVVIFSDGRLPMPAGMPETFLVTDPALDQPADTRVTDLSPYAAVIQAATPTKISVSGAEADRSEVTGDRVVGLANTTGTVRVDVENDAWPENNAMSLEVAQNVARAWLAERPAPPGWTAVDTIPGNASVVYAERFTADVADHLGRGGGLIVGDLAALPPALRGTSPLSPTPPAGDREWLLLLDVSGSMGRADRLERGITALQSAAAQLPADATRGVGSFADDLRWWERGVPATAPLAVPTDLTAGGPTNLRLALQAIAVETDTPRDLLLLTDGSAELDGVDTGSLRISAVVLGDEVPAALAEVVARSGGVIGAGPEWAETAAEVAGDATLPSTPPPARLDWPGIAERDTERVSAWLRDGASALARFDTGEPAVAVWQVGDATVAATAFAPTDNEIGVLADRVEAAPADPSVTVDRRGNTLLITASARPTVRLNGMALYVERDTPTRWTVPLPTPRAANVAVVSLGQRRVATIAVPSGHDQEFTGLGNFGSDAIVGQRLTLPTRSNTFDTSAWLGLAGVVVGGIALTRMLR